jgi:hypothetical protein
MPPETRISVQKLAARIERVELLNRALFLVVAIALVIGGAALAIRHFSQANTAAAEPFAALNANGDVRYDERSLVIAGLDPAIHTDVQPAWTTGSSPVVTPHEVHTYCPSEPFPAFALLKPGYARCRASTTSRWSSASAAQKLPAACGRRTQRDL